MGQWSRIWLYCISDGVPKRSLVVALIVGTILNLINQGDALVAGARLNLTKLILTFAVPYAVATYGAVSYRLRAGSDRKTEDQRRRTAPPLPYQRLVFEAEHPLCRAEARKGEFTECDEFAGAMLRDFAGGQDPAPQPWSRPLRSPARERQGGRRRPL
jgi:hypothetical protein